MFDVTTSDKPINDPVRRAKQALGRTGDFWALVGMVQNINTCKGVLAEIQEADEALRSHLRDQQALANSLADLERSATASVSQASQVQSNAKLAHDRDVVLAAKRSNDLSLREEVIKSTEMSQSQRETALAARESRLAKDAQEIDAKAQHDAKACEGRWSALAIAEHAFGEREAAFERRFAAAKAILAAVPDTLLAGSANAPTKQTANTR